MAEVTKIQTAFRFPPELLEKMKKMAKRNGQSLNAYVESLFERETRIKLPKLPKDYKVSEDILALRCTGHWVEPTREELEADPRLAHALGYEI